MSKENSSLFCCWWNYFCLNNDSAVRAASSVVPAISMYKDSQQVSAGQRKLSFLIVGPKKSQAACDDKVSRMNKVNQYYSAGAGKFGCVNSDK